MLPPSCNPRRQGADGASLLRNGVRLCSGAMESGARMGGVVGLFQSVRRDMRINLRRHKVGMSKKLLHAAQVGSSIEQVSGVAVA